MREGVFGTFMTSRPILQCSDWIGRNLEFGLVGVGGGGGGGNQAGSDVDIHTQWCRKWDGIFNLGNLDLTLS